MATKGNNSGGKQGGRASRATPTAANRGTQTRPGDATGMENERLRKENEAAIRQAATTTTLVNPPPVVEQTDQVVDYSEGGSAHTGNEEGARLISLDEATGDGDTRVETFLGNDHDDQGLDMDSLPDGTVDILPEILEQRTDEPAPAHGERRDSQQQTRQQPAPQVGVERTGAPVVEEAFRVLRVNTDLEDVTIGKDNHYTFRVGVPYKVQKHVYDHLVEKGYALR
jgi:hypothetical protein